MTPRQLPLLIPSGQNYDAASFLPGASNEAARTWLGRTEVWPEHQLALWGCAATGKTHLLRVWAARTGAELLDGAALSGFPVLTSPHGAAVDDADRADAAALLHLLNAARDVDRPVLLVGRAPPARWSTLPDLDSRLRAITAVEVAIPDEALLRQLLMHWLGQRRLVADEALHDRLLLRLPRTPRVLLAAVERLDRDALRSRRRSVTPAMVSDALAAVAVPLTSDGATSDGSITDGVPSDGRAKGQTQREENQH